MDQKSELTISQRIQAWLESFILTRLVPTGSPGPVFRYIFKIPILFYRLGLGGLVGPHFLLLTTVGRKTGQTRYTTLEFTFEQATGTYLLMAGWGKTDWYKNARAHPQVKVQIGWKQFAALAEPLPDEEIARLIEAIVTRAPRMKAVFQRWSNKPIDGTFESYVYAAQFFPCLRLKPVS